MEFSYMKYDKVRRYLDQINSLFLQHSFTVKHRNKTVIIRGSGRPDPALAFHWVSDHEIKIHYQVYENNLYEKERYNYTVKKDEWQLAPQILQLTTFSLLPSIGKDLLDKAFESKEALLSFLEGSEFLDKLGKTETLYRYRKYLITIALNFPEFLRIGPYENGLVLKTVGRLPNFTVSIPKDPDDVIQVQHEYLFTQHAEQEFQSIYLCKESAVIPGITEIFRKHGNVPGLESVIYEFLSGRPALFNPKRSRKNPE